MSTKDVAQRDALQDAVTLIKTQYGCGPVQFAGTDEALYERHLLFDNGVALEAATARDRFEALARSVRDPNEWARRDMLNVAGSGKFSSDRTIAEYATKAGMCRRAQCQRKGKCRYQGRQLRRVSR